MCLGTVQCSAPCCVSTLTKSTSLVVHVGLPQIKRCVPKRGCPHKGICIHVRLFTKNTVPMKGLGHVSCQEAGLGAEVYTFRCTLMLLCLHFGAHICGMFFLFCPFAQVHLRRVVYIYLHPLFSFSMVEQHPSDAASVYIAPTHRHVTCPPRWVGLLWFGALWLAGRSIGLTIFCLWSVLLMTWTSRLLSAGRLGRRNSSNGYSADYN